MASFIKTSLSRIDYILLVPVLFLIVLSTVVLKSIAPALFPQYFLYLLAGIMFYLIFLSIDYEVLELFSHFFWGIGVVLLIITIIIGQATRGAVRWIPFLGFSIQPSEIIRPFLLLYFSFYLSRNSLKTKHLVKLFILVLIPVFLIFIQPSLSVAILTSVGFLGVLLSSGFSKKMLLSGLLIAVLALPLFYLTLKPYQRGRLTTFVNPAKDPYGSGYNSIQSVISVGSGGLIGRGLGKGVQTQLYFLPERHTDFVFASIAEELGFVGSFLVLLCLFFILLRLTSYIGRPISASSRAYLAGIFLSFLVQIFVNVGMNLGVMPVAGLPLPIISAGGSSFLATMMALGIAQSARKS